MKNVRQVLYILVACFAFLIRTHTASADSFTSSCTSCPTEFGISSGGSADGTIAFGLDTFTFGITGGTTSFGGQLDYTVDFPAGGGFWTLTDQFNAVLAQGSFAPGAVGQINSITLADFTAALIDQGTLSLHCEIGPATQFDQFPNNCTYSLDNIKLATPEPGTMLLLGVGVLGIATVKLLKK